jgi:hypothetical protein
MYYPTVADPTKEYHTVFVRAAEREKRVTKRLCGNPSYREFVVVAESWESTGEYTLFRYPAVPRAPPDVQGLLLAVQFLQKARVVHGRINADAIRGGRLANFENAVDMGGAWKHAREYFFEEGPPDKRALGVLAQSCLEMPFSAFLELVKGWKTWDLYDLSGVVDHPLAERCRAENAVDRPTVEECLAALKEPLL